MKSSPVGSGRFQSQRSADGAELLPPPVLSEDLLQSIVNSMADGIVVADPTGRFVLFNPAAEELIGMGLSPTRPSDWSEHYGCFHLDGVTPFQMEELPLVRA